MSNEKKAFVFDTNFIIQNGKLDEVVENLKNDYSVYVTQVSIEERIAQQCRELKVDFEELEKCKPKVTHFADITLKRTYEEECELLQKAIQEKYKTTFGEYIIPCYKDEETFTSIIERANKKQPPFSNAKDASDKGFKDYLLWLSILKYFKSKGETKIIFLTDDKSAFRNHIDFLTIEFNEVTGKTIEFKPNTFYKELMNPDKDPKENNEKEPLPDVEKFRDKIDAILYNLCGVEVEDSWGELYWEKTFTLSKRIDGDYMKVIFNGLYNDIKKYIFDKRVSAENIFDLDERLKNGVVSIEMTSIEAAYRLHEEIKEKYPSLLEQFYATAAGIFNSNYIEPHVEADDEDLPF